MPRAGRSKSAEKATAILHAATDVFLEQGFDASSMDDVARTAGVSKQTVYSHFNNKEGLYRAIIQHKCDEYGLGPSIFDAAADCRHNLLHFGERLMELLISEPVIKMDRLCIANAAERPTLSALYYEAGPDEVRALLEDFLRQRCADNQLAIDDVTLAVKQFIGLLKGDIYTRAIWNLPVPGPAERKRYLDASVSLFLKGHQAL